LSATAAHRTPLHLMHRTRRTYRTYRTCRTRTYCTRRTQRTWRTYFLRITLPNRLCQPVNSSSVWSSLIARRT